MFRHDSELELRHEAPNLALVVVQTLAVLESQSLLKLVRNRQRHTTHHGVVQRQELVKSVKMLCAVMVDLCIYVSVVPLNNWSLLVFLGKASL